MHTHLYLTVSIMFHEYTTGFTVYYDDQLTHIWSTICTFNNTKSSYLEWKCYLLVCTAKKLVQLAADNCDFTWRTLPRFDATYVSPKQIIPNTTAAKKEIVLLQQIITFYINYLLSKNSSGVSTLSFSWLFRKWTKVWK